MTAQPLAALRVANAARTAGSQLKADVRAGRLTAVQALEDPRCESVRVDRLLGAVPGVGSVNALCRAHGVDPLGRVGDQYRIPMVALCKAVERRRRT